jgi:rhamnose transport system permease protein
VLLGAIGPALTFLGVSAYWERALQGAIILAAVAVDAVRERRAVHSAVATADAA